MRVGVGVSVGPGVGMGVGTGVGTAAGTAFGVGVSGTEVDMGLGSRLQAANEMARIAANRPARVAR